MRIFAYLVIIIFVFLIFALFKLEKHEVKYVKSELNNREYLVRDLPDKQAASNLLSRIHMNIIRLVDHLYQYKDSTYSKHKVAIERIKNKINNTIINESGEDSSYTSYSVNKGEQIVFCLRSKYNGELHDINLLMYVAIHELAHVGCESYGHTQEFKELFAFLISVAITLNMYTKINFKENPLEYCGLIISEHI